MNGPMAMMIQASSAWAFAVGLSNLTLRVYRLGRESLDLPVFLWLPKTSSADRINTTRAGGDVQERAYAMRV
jgi:hypothetical protein